MKKQVIIKIENLVGKVEINTNDKKSAEKIHEEVFNALLDAVNSADGIRIPKLDIPNGKQKYQEERTYKFKENFDINQFRVHMHESGLPLDLIAEIFPQKASQKNNNSFADESACETYMKLRFDKCPSFQKSRHGENGKCCTHGVCLRIRKGVVSYCRLNPDKVEYSRQGNPERNQFSERF